MIKLTDILNEGKYDYEVYHSSYSSAVQEAERLAQKKGYEVDEDDWWRKISTGPKKPSKGKTNSVNVKLTKNGQPNNSTGGGGSSSGGRNASGPNRNINKTIAQS